MTLRCASPATTYEATMQMPEKATQKSDPEFTMLLLASSIGTLLSWRLPAP